MSESADNATPPVLPVKPWVLDENTIANMQCGDVLSLGVDRLPFEQWKRITDACRNHGVRLVRDLCQVKTEDFRKWRNCGKRALNSVKDTLSNSGLWLDMTEDDIREATSLTR